MRIVGGEWRNRTIDAPQGRNTRPTTDRMRESLASMILSACDLDLSGHSVLDAFAGSGALGLELLSRGARTCTFCELDGRTAALVRANCKRLGAKASRWRVVRGDVLRLGPAGFWGAPFSVVLLDPPYAMAASDVSRFVDSLARRGQLAENCLVMYERAHEAPGLELGCAELLRTKRMSSSCVDLMRIVDASDASDASAFATAVVGDAYAVDARLSADVVADVVADVTVRDTSAAGTPTNKTV